MLAEGLNDGVDRLLAEVARDYQHCLMAASSQGKDLLPRVAARLGVEMIAEVTGIEGPDTFLRPIYAGNAIARVASSAPSRCSPCGPQRSPRPGPGRSVPDGIAAGGRGALPYPAHRAACGALPPDPSSGRPGWWSPAGGHSARKSTLPSSTLWRTSWGLPSGHRGPPWMPVMSPTTCRWGRPARWWPRALHRGGHLGRHPASGGDEGVQGDRRHQQGRRGPIFQVADYGLVGISSPCCRSSPPSCKFATKGRRKPSVLSRPCFHAYSLQALARSGLLSDGARWRRGKRLRWIPKAFAPRGLSCKTFESLITHIHSRKAS